MIVFATTVKGRVNHLRQTLPRNLADNENYKNCKFVVLDYDSPDDLQDYLRSEHSKAIESGRLVVYSFGPSSAEAQARRRFRMAHAKNMAHRLGILEGARILVNLDADNFTGPGFAHYIAEQFEKFGHNIFLWARMIQQGPEKLVRGISGRIAVTSNAFLKLGGYDEKYDTWAPDDKDFNRRLELLGYVPHEIDRCHLEAIHHSQKMRFREYPHARPAEDVYDVPVIPEDPNTAVVNFGRFGEGVVFRNFGHTPITLGPLPTRIFGIGMQKTGTTSLSHALKTLGFDSAHWETPRWARNVFMEMKEFGKSLTMERHYALSDFPISIMFKELDVAYPGSKFILTVRDEVDWLVSVRNHWDAQINPYRASWNHDAFSHRMHHEVYGRKMFDALIFLERYRRHNDEVREYFRHRPGDLLVMDMRERKIEWHELCKFLGVREPSIDYPRHFVTGEAGVK